MFYSEERTLEEWREVFLKGEYLMLPSMPLVQERKNKEVALQNFHFQSTVALMAERLQTLEHNVKIIRKKKQPGIHFSLIFIEKNVTVHRKWTKGHNSGGRCLQDRTQGHKH